MATKTIRFPECGKGFKFEGDYTIEKRYTDTETGESVAECKGFLAKDKNGRVISWHDWDGSTAVYDENTNQKLITPFKVATPQPTGPSPKASIPSNLIQTSGMFWYVIGVVAVGGLLLLLLKKLTS